MRSPTEFSVPCAEERAAPTLSAPAPVPIHYYFFPLFFLYLCVCVLPSPRFASKENPDVWLYGSTIERETGAVIAHASNPPSKVAVWRA